MAQAVPLIIVAVSTILPAALQYALNAKTKQNPVDIGKLDDVRITGSEYGAFIPRWWGTVRLGGNVFWSDGVKHTIVDYPSEGGKGTPAAPSQRVHIYTSNLGWMIGRTRVNKWGRIWADEQLIIGSLGDNVKTFQAEDSTVATPGGIEGTDWFRTATTLELIRNGSLLFDVSSCELPPLPISGDPDELDAPTVSPRTKVSIYFRTQSTNVADITTDTGAVVEQKEDVLFQNTASQFAVRTFEFVGDLETVDFALTSNSFNLISRLRIDRIVVQKDWYVEGLQTTTNFSGSLTGIADPDAIYDATADDISGYYNFFPTENAEGTTNVATSTIAESFRLYAGTTNQLQDSALIDYLNARYGAGNGSSYAPGHRGIAWIGFRSYGLRRGRIPNFTAEVTNNNNDVNDILTDFAADVDISSGALNLSSTSSLSVYGYLENSKATRLANWINLSQYFGFSFAEIDGKITTILDTFTPAATISADSIRARNYGEESKPYDAEIVRADAFSIPREVRFSTINPALDYFNETSIANVVEGLSSADGVDFNFPIVATADESRQQAERMLLKLHSEIRAVSFTGMPDMMRYTVGDVLTIPLNGDDLLVRIDKKTSALPLGVIQFEGTVLDQYQVGDIETAIKATDLAPLASFQSAFLQAPRNSVAVPIISLPIRDADKGKLGVYVAISAFGVGVAESVSLYQKIADETYVLREIYEVPSVIGDAPTALGTHSNAATEDTTNTLDIFFYNDETLESVTAGELDANPLLNLIRVGDEWVQFRTATVQTLDDASTYRSKWRVSNLRRGRFSTSGEMSGHAANEKVVLVTNNFRFYPLSEAEVGETVTFKAVSAGASLELSPEVSFTFNPLSKYTVTNETDDRTFDADCTTIDELADVVATIIKDTRI